MRREMRVLWRYVLGLAALGLSASTHSAGQVQKSCFAPAGWVALDAPVPRPVPPITLIAEVTRRDVVLLAERHDVADDHRWQLHTLAALQALQPKMVIGFESFPRRVQPVLDRWVAGELSEKQFLEQSEWTKVWSFPAELYLPLFHFARMHRIPMVALNVERELTQSVAKDGWDGVPAAKKEGVTRPAPPSQAYKDALFEIYKDHRQETGQAAGAKEPSLEEPEFLRFVESQTTWDRAMAEALARHVRPGGEVLVVGIMGRGHVEHGHGVAHQLRDLGVTSTAALVPIDASEDCEDVEAGLADAVFVLPDAPRAKRAEPPRPRLGVRLQQAKDGVLLVEVTPGSLAEATGLRKGDLIVSFAGSRAAKVEALVAAVRGQPEGTWLPIVLQREGKTLEFVVKFPAKQ